MALLESHNLTWSTAENTRRNNKIADLATEYFAYVALIGIASAAAVAAIVFSANVAVTWLDHMASPGFFDHPAQATTPVDQRQSAPGTRTASFAMLPASVPLKIRNDVIASDF